MTDRPTFYPSAGDVVWSGNPGKGLSEGDVTALTGLFRDEAKAAWRAGDFEAHRRAADLHAEIFTATFEARRWLRASVSPSNTEWKEAS